MPGEAGESKVSEEDAKKSIDRPVPRADPREQRAWAECSENGMAEVSKAKARKEGVLVGCGI